MSTLLTSTLKSSLETVKSLKKVKKSLEFIILKFDPK